MKKLRLESHVHTIRDGHKDYKCGKLFSDSGKLKRHIQAVHEGHKDHKCESCGKSFSLAQNFGVKLNLWPSGVFGPVLKLEMLSLGANLSP